MRALIFLFAIGIPAAASQMDSGHESATIIAGCEFGYPPFCFVDVDGQPAGFSVDLLRAAAKSMGREISFRVGPWDEVKGWLARDEVDALPVVGRTLEREALFDFTFPYMSMYGAIVVRADTRDINKLEDLGGRQVAVMKGDNAEEFLNQESLDLRIRTTVDFEQALRELSEGQHDAVVIQRLVAMRLIRQAGFANLRIVDRPLLQFRQDWSFAVPEGHKDLLALLNEGLALVIADGTSRRLHAKWFANLELPSNRRIVIGGDHCYPPYEYVDEEGRPAGFNVELTRAIAQEVGLDVEIRLGPWSEIRQGLENGEIDAVHGMFYSSQRDLEYDFSPPHSVIHHVAVTRRESGPPPATLAELSDLRLVAMRGDIMHEFALENGLGDQLTLVPTQEDALRELVEGRYDCALVARLPAKYWIEHHGWNELSIGRHTLYSPEYSYAVPHQRTALLSQFSEGLKLLDENGGFRRIHAKWLGVYEDSHLGYAKILRLFALVGSALGAILIAIGAWSWSLRKQVARRTEELRKSEGFQRAMIACSPVALYSLDLSDRVLTWNSSAQRIFGWSADEVIGKPLPILPPDKREEFHRLRQEVLAGPGFLGREVVRMRRDGTLLAAALSAAPIYDASGNIIGVMGAIEDIRQRKRDEAHIEHLNRVLRAIRHVNQLIVREQDRDTLIREGCRLLVEQRSYDTALILLTDTYGRPETWATAGMGDECAALDGLLRESGLPDCCLAVQAGNEPCLVFHRNAIWGESASAVDRGEQDALCVALRHGDIIHGFLVVTANRDLSLDEEVRGLLVDMASDLSCALSAIRDRAARSHAEQSRNEMQKQLLQAQKMEAVGQLAGGVAHDFNNILQVMMGHTQLLIDAAIQKNEQCDDLLEIYRGTERAAALTRQLLSFSRRQVMQPRPQDLNALIENLLRMLRRVIGEHICLEWLPSSSLDVVQADSTMIEQVLMNLCVNARDAMPQGGTLTIQTRSAQIDAAYCTNRAFARQGKFVVLSVSDTGCGIDEETLNHIFEPFFTTKDVGTGTGLGLATVHGIVRQHDGWVEVLSQSGQGAKFSVFLPAHAATASPIDEREAQSPAPGGTETILLVEDEAPLRALTRRFLEGRGYTVIEAGSGREALNIWPQHRDRVDLLITDLVMPEGISGRHLSERLREDKPTLGVVLTSGYSPEVAGKDTLFIQRCNSHFLPKPYATRDLLRAIRSSLLIN
jgi:PAS domain S-box-containing protein